METTETIIAELDSAIKSGSLTQLAGERLREAGSTHVNMTYLMQVRQSIRRLVWQPHHSAQIAVAVVLPLQITQDYLRGDVPMRDLSFIQD